MDKTYNLEKWNWNENDFHSMSWYDCVIRSLSFEKDVKFDLDYCLRTEFSTHAAHENRYWMSPATLAFRNPTLVSINFKFDTVNGCRLINIHQEVLNDVTSYHVTTFEGDMIIESNNFELIIRRPSTLQISYIIPDMERGEGAFSENSNKDYKPSQQQIDARELTYRFADLRDQKNQIQDEFEKFNFELLNPKEKILKRRFYQNRIKEITIEIEQAVKVVNDVYGYKFITL